MPELPEVEIIVRDVRPEIIGRRILGVLTDWPKYFAFPRSAFESVVRALENAGALLQPGWPPDFSISELFSDWYTMAFALVFSLATPEKQERQRAEFAAHKDGPQARAALIDFASWQRLNFRRLAFRALWQEYFGTSMHS